MRISDWSSDVCSSDLPGFIAEEIAAAAGTWSSYPPPRGSDAYRIACAEGLTARVDLPADMLDQQKHILPLTGSREGLFFAVVAAAQAYKGAQPPVVLLPNPFYHVYDSSALADGAHTVFVHER